MEQERAICYRCRRSHFWLGLWGSVFYLLMGAGSFVVAFWNLDGSFSRPVRAVVLFAVFWGLFLVLGIWMMLFALRYRLWVTGEEVRQAGCFFTKVLRWAEIVRVQWRSWPAGGSVVLRGGGRRIVVEFGNLPEQDRQGLSRLLREKSGGAIQEGWEPFSSRWISAAAAATPSKWSTGVLLAVVFLLMAGLFAMFWRLERGVFYGFLAVLNVVAAAWCMRRGRAAKTEGGK